MYGLVDCNNFYASCERLFNPNLRDKPIVVLSNNDGCVVARSNEAKALNIPMGAPAFEYQKLFDAHNVSVFSSNYALYGDISDRIMTILKNNCPLVEVYSIDEAFLDFKGFTITQIDELCKKLKNQIYKWTGIPVSIGVARTKALAKVANRIAKKYPEYHKGVYLMLTEPQRVKALKWLDVADIWGIGRQHTKKLHRFGIRKAYDFTLKSEQWVRSNFSVVEARLHRDLCGLATLTLETVKTKKAIGTNRSFSKMVTDIEILKERISTYALSCAFKLRKQNSDCSLISIYLATNYFRQDLPQYRNSITIPLPYATNTDFIIGQFANKGLKMIFKPGYHYKRAGVLVYGITPNEKKQLSLFSEENPKHRVLMKTMDNLNFKIGRDKVRMASEDLGRKWKMKQEKLSPNYTTSWSDILKI